MDYKVRIIKDYSKQSKMFGSGATGTSDLAWVFSNWCTYRGDEFVSVRVSGQALEIPYEGFEVFDPIRTDFEDRIYSMNVIDDSFGKPTAVKPTPIDTKDFRTYDEKAEEWVKNRFDDPSIMKIRMFEPLSAEDEKRLSDSISDLGDEAEATDFFSAVKPIVFIRKTAGIDEKAQKRFVASESSKYGLSDQQAIFVGQLIRFISANGYFTETILLNADDFADFTEIFKDQNTLPSIIDDIKLRMGA
jgi:hypothetical protein